MTGLVLCLLVALGTGLVAAMLLGRQHVPQAAQRGGTSPPGAEARGTAAAALLDRLAVGLQQGSRADVVALARPGDTRARRELATLRSNVRALRIVGLGLHYAGEDPGAGPEASPAGRAATRGIWAADVRLTWRIGGFDRHVSRRHVALTLAGVGSRALFVTARTATLAQPATPLWMLGPVRVARTADALVVTGRAGPEPYARLADRAVADVRRVVPDWRGRLVVEVPRDEQDLDRVLGASPGDYREIAAVTSTADGSTSTQSPSHIFVNPDVLDPLGPHGSQIVMSHEATHVATGAALSTMPRWLVEGFADYVALDHAGLPVDVAAREVLAGVRRTGPPAHLPGPADFAATNPRLGASYESAWLAVRLLGDRYGERRLLRFYRAADRAAAVERPLRSVLGTDLTTFTEDWRDELWRLAR